jgi:hypothetical protein
MLHLEYQVALIEVSWQKRSFFQHEINPEHIRR